MTRIHTHARAGVRSSRAQTGTHTGGGQGRSWEVEVGAAGAHLAVEAKATCGGVDWDGGQEAEVSGAGPGLWRGERTPLGWEVSPSRHTPF